MKSKWKYFGLIALLILAFSLLYSTYTYLNSGADQGIYFCENEECYWAPGDIHAQVTVTVCGKQLDLPRNFGSDQEVHTHREKNLLHFEYKLLANIQTKTLLDTTPLQLGTFFSRANLTFNERCILNACNGMLCGGKKAELYMLVNGKESSKFERYVWSDRDSIEINFEAIESTDGVKDGY